MLAIIGWHAMAKTTMTIAIDPSGGAIERPERRWWRCLEAGAAVVLALRRHARRD
jgi:hypothetical protein